MKADLMLAFWLAHVAVLLIPGPNVLLVMAYGMTTSRQEAAQCALGIATGTVVWCAAASHGLSLLLQTAPRAASLVGIAAAAYLLHLAWKVLKSGQPGHLPQAGGFKSAYAAGLLASMSNIKSGIFFASAFAAALSVHKGMALELSLLATLNSLAWHLGLALFLSTFTFLRTPAYGRVIRCLSSVAIGTVAVLTLAQAMHAAAMTR